MGDAGAGEFERRFRKQLEECGLPVPGGRVVAAVSGGADSVCLLALLAELFSGGEIELRAVHVHHGLRGEEADRDASWVEELCRSMKVPCRIFHEDVRGFAEEGKMSEEEAGRILRYRRLQEAAEEWENQEPGEKVLIAAAHHQEDQAETILHNLCRGSGLKGIGGMEKRRGRLIRPLLEESRQEILKWLKRKGLTYCQDSTNASDHYTRNRIRSHLIPVIRNEVNGKGVENIARMGQIAALADDFLEQEAARWLERSASGEREMVLPEEEFGKLHKILQLYAVRLALAKVMGQQRNLTGLHVREIQQLFGRQTGRRILLPGGYEARREYGGVWIGKRREQEAAPAVLPEVEFCSFSWKKGTEIPKKQYTKWFDCDRIKGTPALRFRQEGDYITLPGGKKKALRRYMIDEKIPARLRDGIPLLADGSHVIWMIGYRISEYYKVGPDTVRVLQASVRQEEDKKDTEEK
ncbi:MAG TPA: tRNA lysidine(34) synthetase TilS [Candidatus Enterocloster faecavium]|uniref:tRNA(Ile)-lysidine synthase n=1 Tax=Candidatus Enterocloster faecavium TaxID=2838560 RepID=A0A9D2L6Y2_9FIRM|nr:tRNA lysidine(34) synthetase TilS [Candidatus Enterocloster faecavium]